MEVLLIGICIVGGITSLIIFLYHRKNDELTMEERSDKLAKEKYNTNQTRRGAERERKASEARTKNAAQIANEINAMGDIVAAQTRVKLQNLRDRDAVTTYNREQEMLEKDHQLQLAIKENHITATKIANQMGMRLEFFEQMMLEKMRLELMSGKELEQMKSQLRISEHKQISGINDESYEKRKALELKDYQDKANHDLATEVEEAKARLKFKIISSRLVNEQQIALIEDFVQEQYQKIEEAEASDLSREAKDQIIRSREAIIEMYRNEQREAQTKISLPGSTNV